MASASLKTGRETKGNTPAEWGLLLGAVLCFALFAYLTMLVEQGATHEWDLAMAEKVYALRREGLSDVVIALTTVGNWPCIVGVSLALLALPAARLKAGLPMAAMALVTNGIRFAVKLLVARPRPEEIFFLIEEDGWSFPSGHAITSLAFYGMFAWLILHYRKEEGWKPLLWGSSVLLCVIFAVGIGLSRIYLGVHYPCDVLGGWLAGLGTLLLGIFVVLRVERRR